ncbi:MAG: ATP-binding protein [Verrucomicrobiaceae bacterium]|nr:ATP-binding protein [Verrucomicrobiaceae bacterium]
MKQPLPSILVNLLTKIDLWFQSFFHIIRHGTGKAKLTLIFAVFLIAGFFEYLPADVRTHLPLEVLVNKLPWVVLTCQLIAGVTFVVLLWSWSKALLPRKGTALSGQLSTTQTPSIFVGAQSFSIVHGKLFQRLERKHEIDSLLLAVGTNRLALVSLRGESGAGKSSLLNSGLAWVLNQEKIPVIYAEIIPGDVVGSILKASKEGWIVSGDDDDSVPDLQRLQDISGASKRRRVLILDQFEQIAVADKISRNTVYDFIKAHVLSHPPYQLLIIVGFRRDFFVDWQDFTDSTLKRAHQTAMLNLSLKYFTISQARNIIAELAASASLQVEAGFVDEYLKHIARDTSDFPIAPVDLSILMLGLKRIEVKTGKRTVSEADFHLDGGASGMITSFFRETVADALGDQPLEIRRTRECAVYQALLKLGRQDGKRLAEGLTLDSLFSGLSGINKSEFKGILEYLGSPAARLLEVVPSSKSDRVAAYRLAHDRLVEPVNRLGGAIVADQMKASTLFESAFQGYIQFGEKLLLQGRDLRLVERNFPHFNLGADSISKTDFLKRSQRRRFLKLVMKSVAVFAVIACGVLAYNWQVADTHRNDLARMGLPGELFDKQGQLDSLEVFHDSVDSIAWVDGEMTRLAVVGSISNLTAIKSLPNSISSLSLQGNQITEWSWLSQLDSNIVHLEVSVPVRLSANGEWEYENPVVPAEFSKIPNSVKSLGIHGLALAEEGFDFSVLPQSLVNLRLDSLPFSRIGLIGNLPSSLERLHIEIDPGEEMAFERVPWPSVNTELSIAVSDFVREPWFDPESLPENVRQTIGENEYSFDEPELMYLPADQRENVVVIVRDVEGADDKQTEEMKNSLRRIPSFVSTVCLRSAGSRYNRSKVSSLGYKTLEALPSTVKTLRLEVEFSKDSHLLDLIPASIERIEVESLYDSQFLPDSILGRIVKGGILNEIYRGETPYLEEYRAIFSKLPLLEEIGIWVQPGFRSLEFLGHCQKLRELALYMGESRFSGFESLEGLPKSVRKLVIRTDAGS